MLEDFAVFITTHGRPDNVMTYYALRKQNYTGPIYLICDNEDKTLAEYIKRYGEQVIVFDKLAASKYVDTGDNLPGRGAVVFARNECFRIARELGIRYFLQVDDDYRKFSYAINSDFQFTDRAIGDLDKVFDATLRYFDNAPIHCIAFAQGGDFIGGGNSDSAKAVTAKRKMMNTFFLDTEREFDFLGRMNDDVNAYVTHGYRGKVMLTIVQLRITQPETQKVSGGMTDIYKDSGTYQKSFYSVMYAPAFVKIFMMGYKEKRLHHKIKWGNAAPCIVPEKYRKASANNHYG